MKKYNDIVFDQSNERDMKILNKMIELKQRLDKAEQEIEDHCRSCKEFKDYHGARERLQQQNKQLKEKLKTVKGYLEPLERLWGEE